MREIRLKRRDMEQRFAQGVVEQYQKPQRKRKDDSPTADGGMGELALMDSDQLEQNLALDAIAVKLRGQHQQSLAHFIARLNALAGRTQFDEDNNPLDPGQIAWAFGHAMAVLTDANINCRLVVFKLFERHLYSRIGSLLDEANKLLIEEGVLPQIKAQPRRTSSEAMRQRQEARTVLNGSQARNLLDTLHQLLNLDQDGGGHEGLHHSAGSGATGHAYSGSVYPVSDMVSVLSGLQQMTADAQGEDMPLLTSSEIRNGLRTGLARNNASGRLGRLEDSTIEIVGLLFDAVLNDPNIPDRIKALLARLQIPMLKVALVDPSLFEKPRHPARRLINEMARAGVGWTDSGQAGGDPLLQIIEEVVADILEDTGDNVAMFSRCLDQFERFVDDERERARQIEVRTRQAAEGKVKVDVARTRVLTALRERVQGRDLPQVVHQLLDQAWSKVLFIPMLKEGNDSPLWRERLSVVDRLIRSVEPKVTQEQRKMLVSEIPTLLQDMRAGMDAIMFNPEDMNRMFKALEAEHIRLLTQPLSRSTEPRQGADAAKDSLVDYKQSASVPEQAVDTPAAAPEVRRMGPAAMAPGSEAGAGSPAVSGQDRMAAPWEDPLPEADGAGAPPSITEEFKGYYKQLDKAAIGTWFEFLQDNGRTIRAKLSARLGDGDRLIFVNRAGFKLSDRHRHEMAEAMHNRRLSILDDDMLFDKALEALVANLRNMSQQT